MSRLLEVLKVRIRRKRQLPDNLNTVVGLVGLTIQTIGVLLLHILLTTGLVFGAYAIISITILSPFWLMYLLSIIIIGLSIVGIAAIAIDIAELITVIKELKNGNYKQALQVIKITAIVVLSIIIIVISIITVCSIVKSNNSDNTNNDNSESTNADVEQYPITDLWVYRYDAQTKESPLSPCGYLDQYTSLVAETDKKISKVITGSYMYLGTIKGYQNDDKTISVYQVKLPELSANFVLTNDNFVFDYSGSKKMVEIDGWIYMDGTTIHAVSPLYEN